MALDRKNDGERGIYCFYPFDRLDEFGKGCFKIGVTTASFQQRLQSYMTYFPNGVYKIAYIHAYIKGAKKQVFHYVGILDE